MRLLPSFGILNFLIAVLWLLCSPAAAITPQNAAINANVMSAMKTQFVGHVSLDTHILNDVEPVSACKTKFSTSAGSIVIDWSVVQNPAPELTDNQDIVPIKAPDGVHDFSVPGGSDDEDLDERMESGIGLLYSNCTSVN